MRWINTTSKRFAVLGILATLTACGGVSSPEFDGETSNDDLTITPTPDVVQGLPGESTYATQCASCHGDKGQGGAAGGELKACDTCGNLQSLIDEIRNTMPLGNPSNCGQTCSEEVANYIFTNFVNGNSNPSNSSSSGSTGSSGSSSSSSSSGSTGSSSSSSSGSASGSTSSSTSGGSNSSSSGSTSSSSGGSANAIIAEGFESAAVNTQPSGWSNFLGYNYESSDNKTTASNYALVDDTKAHTGNKSIHFKGSLAQIIQPLPANTQRLHMRAFVNMSVQMGSVSGDNHEHIMGIKKTTDANNEVRIGQIKGVLGTNQVPSDDIAPTQDKWYTGKALVPDTWYCIETALYADTDYDEVHMWVDGELVHSVTQGSDWQNGALSGDNDWMSDMFNYVMFGFHSFSGRSADVWMDDIVVSTEAIGCGTGTGSSSSSSSGGHLETGKALYESSTMGCVGCHGATGEGSYKISADKTTYNGKSLADYINDEMPPGNSASLCTGDCASDIAAYIKSWSEQPSSGSSSSSSGSSSSSSGSPSAGSCSVAYGPRLLRVLTRNEFVNSIEDITGLNVINSLGKSVYDAIPADNKIDGFSNNILTSVESGALQSYGLVVNKIVSKLAETKFANMIDCSSLNVEACGSAFIEKYGPKIFRRPLKDDEAVMFTELFSTEYTGGDVNEGISLALRTMLTSPQFLYRDETGVSIVDIKNGTSDDPEYEQVGTIQTAVTADDPKEIGYDTHIGLSNLKFTNNDLLVFTAKGTQSGEGDWPVVKFVANDVVIASQEISHTYPKTYKFHVTELTGDYNYVGIEQVKENTNRSSQVATISSVEVSAAKQKVQTQPTVELDDNAYVLTPYQMASFLSFTFAGTTPDEELLLAAQKEELETREQIAAQVERLIKSSSARKHFGDFAAEWLKTDRVLDIVKDLETYPDFTPDVRQAMAQEVREIFNHVVLDEGEDFTKLFDGDFTFLNESLANFYGVSGVSGSSMQKVTGVNDRAGLVTSGAFMTVNAHEQETGPILRATRLRRRFLCHDVPAPPTGVSITGDDFDEAREAARVEWEKYLEENNGLATSRKKYEFQTSSSICMTCHEKMINPLGFGFEDFDAVGKPQSVDYNGLTINSSGVLYGIEYWDDGQEQSFNGAKELAHAIAGLDATRRCFIENTFRMAMGTGSTYLDRNMSIGLSQEEKDNYSCEIDKLDNEMKSNDYSTKALLKAIGTMDSVRYRKDVQR